MATEYLTLNMNAQQSLDISVALYKPTRHNIPKEASPVRCVLIQGIVNS
jgi:hypothetical protein